MTMNARVEVFSTADGRDAVGFEVLAGIRERLAGGAALIVNRERGFARIGSRLAQQVEAAAPRIHRGVSTTRVGSRIPVLQELRGDAEAIERTLTKLNHFADCYRYVYDAAAGTVYSEQSALVHAGSLAWWTPLLATAFALQLQRADEDADRLQQHLGGHIASAGSPHIVKFRRHVRPAPRRATGPAPAGRRGNRFANAFEFGAIADWVNRQNAFSAGTTAAGVAIDAPFDRTTALVLVQADKLHPRSGEGLAVFTLLPIFGRYEELARIAAWLNRREAAGEVLGHGLGAWSVAENDSSQILRHTFNVPKDAWASGLALQLANAALAKLGRINALLNPGVPEANVTEIIEQRLARFTAAAG
jgi:hypothetical protein